MPLWDIDRRYDFSAVLYGGIPFNDRLHKEGHFGVQSLGRSSSISHSFAFNEQWEIEFILV